MNAFTKETHTMTKKTELPFWISAPFCKNSELVAYRDELQSRLLHPEIDFTMRDHYENLLGEVMEELNERDRSEADNA
jgi:hypothetical protein